MSRLTDLLAKAKDSQLAADLEHPFKLLSSRLPFSLSFERHSPEAVELPLRPVRKGHEVRLLPNRSPAKKGDRRLWQVKAIHKATKIAELEQPDTAEPETQSMSLIDLIVVTEFRDTIYPGLVSTRKTERGGDKPFHIAPVDGKTVVADIKGKEKTFNEFWEDADVAVIDDAYRRAARIFSPDIARTYVEHLAQQVASVDDDPEELLEALVEARVTVAGLGLVTELRSCWRHTQMNTLTSPHRSRGRSQRQTAYARFNPRRCSAGGWGRQVRRACSKACWLLTIHNNASGLDE